MKSVRKGTKCLNCGELLQIDNNYCPNCGQKNDHQRVSIWRLTVEFLSNYFSLDSRFGNSLVPFLFQPGVLTLRFREGKRVAFVNPIRLYIILSVVYFFLVSLLVDQLTDEVKTNNKEGLIKLEQELKLPDEVSDSLMADFNASNTDAAIQLDTSTQFTLFDTDWKNYTRLKEQDLTIDQIYDSLKVEEKPFFESLIVKQFVRIDQSEVENITSYLAKNLSVMMFFLLPVVALIFKLVYIRRKHFYFLDHLIHSIHLHAFAYFILSISIIFNLLWQLELTEFALLLLLVYVLFSIKRVYNQSWKKTILKSLLVGWMYFFIFLLAFILEILISLLIF